MIVIGQGACRFGDYWRFGLPFLGLFSLVAVFLVRAVWSF
jgi:di/tricarboxylate transporter